MRSAYCVNRTGVRLALLLALILLTLALAGEPPPVEFLHVHRFITDDSPIVFDLRIRPNEHYRWFRVEAIDDVGESVHAMERPLPAETTRKIEWEPVSAGEYELVARVYGVNEKGEADQLLARANSHFQVIGPP